VAGTGAALLVVAALIALREAAGLARLGRLDTLRAEAEAAQEAIQSRFGAMAPTTTIKWS